jgi:hypothetical protein
MVHEGLDVLIHGTTDPDGSPFASRRYQEGLPERIEIHRLTDEIEGRHHRANDDKPQGVDKEFEKGCGHFTGSLRE